MPVSKRCKEIYGFELNSIAIEDAKKNSKLNNISNAFFSAVDLHISKDKISDLWEGTPFPDVVIVDPPRSGLHPNIIKRILELKPKKLVYVSCNPATQARDLAELLDIYELRGIHPIDMFPHTYHIESIAELFLK